MYKLKNKLYKNFLLYILTFYFFYGAINLKDIISALVN